MRNINWLSYLEVGMFVTIYLRDGIRATGKVQKKDEEVIILLNSNERKLVVSDLTNVLLFEELDPPFVKEKAEKMLNELAEKTSSIIKESNLELSEKNIAELQRERQKIDQQIIDNKVKDHTLSGHKKVYYGVPNFFQKRQPE